MKPYDAARAAFNAYAAMNTPDLPSDPGAALQVKLYRWTRARVPRHGVPLGMESVLGMAEELGELTHAVFQLTSAIGRLAHLELNQSQGRRGYDQDVEKFRALIADALADTIIFAHGAATASRLDFWTLVRATAEEVLSRDWTNNPLSGKTP